MKQTTNYKLNQWVKSDQVRMEDFNADNAKIDAAIKAVDQRADSLSTGKADKTALATAENTLTTRVNSLSTSKADKTALATAEAKIPRLITGSYTGTGGTSGVRRITLSGRPKVVMIRTEYPNNSHHEKVIIITDICVLRCSTYSSFSAYAPGSGYALEDKGFTVPANCDQNYANAPQYYLAVI